MQLYVFMHHLRSYLQTLMKFMKRWLKQHIPRLGLIYHYTHTHRAIARYTIFFHYAPYCIYDLLIVDVHLGSLSIDVKIALPIVTINSEGYAFDPMTGRTYAYVGKMASKLS